MQKHKFCLLILFAVMGLASEGLFTMQPTEGKDNNGGHQDRSKVGFKRKEFVKKKIGNTKRRKFEKQAKNIEIINLDKDQPVQGDDQTIQTLIDAETLHNALDVRPSEQESGVVGFIRSVAKPHATDKQAREAVRQVIDAVFDTQKSVQIIQQDTRTIANGVVDLHDGQQEIRNDQLQMSVMITNRFDGLSNQLTAAGGEVAEVRNDIGVVRIEAAKYHAEAIERCREIAERQNDQTDHIAALQEQVARLEAQIRENQNASFFTGRNTMIFVGGLAIVINMTTGFSMWFSIPVAGATSALLASSQARSLTSGFVASAFQELVVDKVKESCSIQ